MFMRKKIADLDKMSSVDSIHVIGKHFDVCEKKRQKSKVCRAGSDITRSSTSSGNRGGGASMPSGNSGFLASLSGSFRKRARQFSFGSWDSSRGATLPNHYHSHNLGLFDEPSNNLLTPYISGYTTPGPSERHVSKHGRADLGVMLGVYLPTIQHILGVTMFIRLAWCVGVAGIGHTFIMLLICCLCTFLTCISVSAVATNGVVEGGGAYFMISRNLGPEFGSAVGLLFYLANTVASAMYLVGGVEILLLYLAPDLTIGGDDVHTDTSLFGMMSNNLRMYGTALLIIEFIIVAMGVRFVQLLAPVSLICVIASILACYAGSIEKTLNPLSGQRICMFYSDRVGSQIINQSSPSLSTEGHLLQARAFMPDHSPLSELCNYCNWNNTKIQKLVQNAYPNELLVSSTHFSPSQRQNRLRCANGFPGWSLKNILSNLGTNYPAFDEYSRGKKAIPGVEVFQDVNTSFFLLLAIYFPAVTGILTGTNMSGDLANPQKSIPAGTIAAQLTTSFIYFSLAAVFGGSIVPELLRDKYGQSLYGQMVVAGLAWPSDWVVLVGSFLSTFGAALQCLCSAPRLLQSIAKDDVIPFLRPFGKVTSKNEPFNGLVITTLIAWIAILMGAMDSIAAVVDFFFLMCYAFVNLTCALHSILGAPNWRPRYVYYHWTLALLGAGLCFFIMFTTHWDYAIVSIFLCGLIYKYTQWKGAKKEWGDGMRGLALSTAQLALMQIPEKDPHPKNWRPQLLILHSMPWSKDIVDHRYLSILNFASQLKAGKGLTMVVSFLRGNACNEADIIAMQQVKARMEADMQTLRLRGFVKALLYDEDQITGSVNALIQSIGIGGLRPNTLLLCWPIRGDIGDTLLAPPPSQPREVVTTNSDNVDAEKNYSQQNDINLQRQHPINDGAVVKDTDEDGVSTGSVRFDNGQVVPTGPDDNKLATVGKPVFGDGGSPTGGDFVEEISEHQKLDDNGQDAFYSMSTEEENVEYQTFTDKLVTGAVNGMALVVVRGIAEFPSSLTRLQGVIDIYWIVRDGGLCVLIAFLLRQNKVWRHCKIRIIAVASASDNNERLKEQLKDYVYHLRVEAEIMIVELSDPELSKTAFERTLLMEERTKMLREIQQQQQQLTRRSVSGSVTSNNIGNAMTGAPHTFFTTPSGMYAPSAGVYVDYGATAVNLGPIFPQTPAPQTQVNQQQQQMLQHVSNAQVEPSTSAATTSSMASELRVEATDCPSGLRIEATDYHQQHNDQQQEIQADVVHSTSALFFQTTDKDKRRRMKALDRRKVHKMHGAIRLNQLILEHSGDSQLVLLSLPRPPVVRDDVDDYMQYLEVISDKLRRVLFVRGTGAEVITTSS